MPDITIEWAHQRVEWEHDVTNRQLVGELPWQAGITGHRILSSRQAVHEWRVVVSLLGIMMRP